LVLNFPSRLFQCAAGVTLRNLPFYKTIFLVLGLGFFLWLRMDTNWLPKYGTNFEEKSLRCGDSVYMHKWPSLVTRYNLVIIVEFSGD